MGHPPHVAYIALATNEPIAKVKAELIRVRPVAVLAPGFSALLSMLTLSVLQKMIQPCGPPPVREGDEPIRFLPREEHNRGGGDR